MAVKKEDIKTTKIIICGGRHFNDYGLLMTRLNDIIASKKVDIKQVEIVSGHCEGADMLGEKCAADLGAKCTVFSAQWKKYGRSAGPIRNKQMIDYIKDCDNPIVLAFVNERTKGTRNTVSLAQKNNIPVFQYEY